MTEHDAPDAAERAAETIGGLGDRLKSHFEAKRWRELGELLDLPSVWFLDAPKDLDEALGLAAEVLGEANDVEVSLVRVLSSEPGSAARGSYTCCLAWIEPPAWKQHEVQFDLHLGFEQNGAGRWTVAYLGVTRAAAEMAAPPPDHPVGAGSEEPVAAFAAPGACGTAREGGRVVVYVPVSVPEETVRALLRARGEPE